MKQDLNDNHGINMPLHNVIEDKIELYITFTKLCWWTSEDCSGLIDERSMPLEINIITANASLLLFYRKFTGYIQGIIIF